MATNLNKVIMSAIGVLVSSILSVISAFTVLLFFPLLNQSNFVVRRTVNATGEYGAVTTSAGTIVQTVYPILIVLIPLMTFVAGMVVTVLVVKNSR